MQLTTPKDERASSLWLDTLQLKLREPCRPQLFAEPDAARFGGQERVGTALDDEAIEVLGHDLATEAIVRFDQRHPRPGHRVRMQLQQTVCRGKTGDASTEHDDMAGCRGSS